jgi:transposase-like protein
MAGKKGMKGYSLEIKQEAIRMALEKRMAYREITQILGIRNSKRLRDWLWQYRREGELFFHKKKGRPPKGMSEQAELERLRMENTLLKKYHTELRKSLLAKRNIGSPITTGRNSR